MLRFPNWKCISFTANRDFVISYYSSLLFDNISKLLLQLRAAARYFNCTLHFIKSNPFPTFIILLHSPCCLSCLLSIRCNRFFSFLLTQLLVFFLGIWKICILREFSIHFCCKVSQEEAICAFFHKPGLRNSFLMRFDYASYLKKCSWLFCIISCKGWVKILWILRKNFKIFVQIENQF